MPIYEYVCDHCGSRFERIQRFSDDPIRICPDCNTESVRRVLSPAGIIFKGSGWYITDSRQLKSGAKEATKELALPRKRAPPSPRMAPGRMIHE